jgi:PAS domain S-box-containing protein
LSCQPKSNGPEAKCLELVNSLPEMIFEVDQEMNIIFANVKSFEITGYSQEDFAKGFKMPQLIAPEDLERAKNNMEKVFSGGNTKGNEYTFIKKDGSRFFVSVSAVPIIHEGKRIGGRGIITDITETKKIETQLKLFSNAIQTSVDGIIIRTNSAITYVNDALLKMYGSTDKNELIGKHVLQLVDESDQERANQNYIHHQKTGQGWTSQYTAVIKDGSKLPVEITEALIKDENGVGIGHIDIIRDLSQRVRNEEKLKEANQKIELINEKLLVVGGLVRHDIANKLSAIDCSLYLAKKTGKIEDLLREVEVASGQIKRILAFSKDYETLGTEELTYINVGYVFDGVISLFPDLSGIKITNNCVELSVLADSLLKELFYNLVDNTRKYGEKTTQIKISFTDDGQCMNLIYEDDGVGISLDQKPKLFTKGFGRGTGLGLHLIKKTLEVYGWQIQETGTPQKGAKFEITIPKNNQDKINYQIQK